MSFEKKSEYYSEIFEDVVASGADVSSKNFDGCTFKRCDFSEVAFSRCRFIDCEFIGCNLSVVTFGYSKLAGVIFRDSKLIGVDWTKVSWPALAISAPVSFYHSIINDGSFQGLSLQGVILGSCKAHHVDFRDSDFSHSRFSNTEFSGAFFVNTNLTGVDFSEATDYDIDINNNIVKKARFSRVEAVRLLEGLDIELVD